MWSLVLLAILAGPQCGPSYQSSHFVYLSDNLRGYGCMAFPDTIPGLRQIYVLMSTPGATAVEFSAPLPSCVVGGTYISEHCPYAMFFGNSQTGIQIGFSSCLSGNAVHVLTINYWMSAQDEICCELPVLPHPNSSIPGQIGIADCNYEFASADGWGLLVGRSGATVDNPVPPDGATNQPLHVQLDWTEHWCTCSLCISMTDVYFGTAPDPPLFYVDGGMRPYPFDPGPLQPATTYYWKLRTHGLGDYWTSPVWSFTTTEAVAVEEANWGAIKALYE